MKLSWKNPIVITIGLMLLVIGLLFQSVIFGGKTFGSPDSMNPKAAGIAINDLAEKNGEYPLWQPWIFSGMPTNEAFSNVSHLYFPEHLFRIAGFSGMIIQLFHLLFAGIGGILLLKYLKCSRWASALGSTAFMFTPYMITMVVFGHGSQMMTASYIPWVFWLTLKLWDKPSLQNAGWLAMLLGFQLQRAHVQIAYYTWLLIGAYVLSQVIVGLFNADSREKIGRSFTLFALACIIGIGISLLIYLPAMEYSPFSVRGSGISGGAEYGYATAWSFHPKELLTFLIPSAFGFGGITYWGKMPFTDYPNYMGIFVLLLALVGILLRRDKLTVFLTVSTIVALLIAFGQHFRPVYNLFYNFAPYFDKFRVPSMILILVQFNVAILAAIGLDNIIALKDSKTPRWLVFVSGFASLVFLILLIGRNWIEAVVRARFTAPPVQDPNLVQAINNLRWESWYNDAWFMFLFAALLIIAIWILFKNKLDKSILVGAIVVLSVIDISRVDDKIINPDPNSGRNPQLLSKNNVDSYFRRDEVTQFLQEQDGQFRIYPLHNFNDPRLQAFGIESVGGYHPVKLDIYNSFLVATGNIGTEALMRMMNIKYLLSHQPINHSSFRLVFQGDLRTQTGFRETFIYELDKALPRAWFVNHVEILETIEEVWQSITSQDFNPLEVAFIDQSIDQIDYALGEISEIQITPHKISFSTKNSGSGFLVLSEIHYPVRWKVYIDDQVTEIYKTNGVIRGIVIPAGEHEIEFCYDKSIFVTSKVISICAFLIAFGMVLIPNLKRLKKNELV
ncbi:hypothetical protein ACFL46_03020 [Candidatus Neomarinimicrobiota bacterium]